MDNAYGHSNRRVIFSRCPTPLCPSSTFSILDINSSYLTEPKPSPNRDSREVRSFIRVRHCNSTHFAMAPVQGEASREHIFSNNLLNVALVPTVRQKVVYLRKVRGMRKRRELGGESPVELKATKLRFFSPPGREPKVQTPGISDTSSEASKSPIRPAHQKSTEIHLFLGHKAIANPSFSIRRTFPAHHRYNSAFGARC